MFKLALIAKYLRRKLAPMFAALAVTLCTMMVIIVISVMGGFLDQLRDAAHRITGDVVITTHSLTGFAHYQQIAEQLEAQEEIAAAAPMIRSFGLLQIGQHTQPAEVVGIEPSSLDRVVQYRESLHWSTQDHLDAINQSYGPEEALDRDTLNFLRFERQVAAETDYVEMGMTLQPPRQWQPDERERQGMVIGIELLGQHTGQANPRYQWRRNLVGVPLTLTVVPLTERGTLYEQPESRPFVIVNESKSGLHEVDANTVYVPFDQLQRMLRMEQVQTPRFDPETGEDLPGYAVTPGRATHIIVAGAPGHDLSAVYGAAQRVVDMARDEYPELRNLSAQTWQQVHQRIIDAVQNEKGLVTFLLIIISGVAVVMVATTFYMIVLEKTRDIGVLRAIGASQWGIMNVFLGYGLAIGAVGAAAGLGLAYLIVTYLNELHDWMGWGLGSATFAVGCTAGGAVLGAIVGSIAGRRRRRAFHASLIGAAAAAAVGLVAALLVLQVSAELAVSLNETIRFQMWNPETYMFDRIPTRVDPLEAILIVVGAIVSSVIGALIPAIIASRLDPVQALRYE